MLGDLSAMLRLQGDVTGEAAELVRRLMGSMGATDPNKRAPPAHSSPRDQKAQGYEKISASADRIQEQTFKLPVPQKGQKLLTDSHPVVQDRWGNGGAFVSFLQFLFLFLSFSSLSFFLTHILLSFIFLLSMSPSQP
jgi:hypothetical protein